MSKKIALPAEIELVVIGRFVRIRADSLRKAKVDQ